MATKQRKSAEAVYLHRRIIYNIIKVVGAIPRCWIETTYFSRRFVLVTVCIRLSDNIQTTGC